MKKILITDKIHPRCIEILEKNSFKVEYKPELSSEELLKTIQDYNALLVRSATQVTSKVIESAGNLELIGRAGAGVDNIDIDAATLNGVIVMNTPGAIQFRRLNILLL